MEFQLSHIWTAAAVLAGFHIAAFTWRVNREIKMESECRDTWVTLADGIAFASFLVVVIGVFAGPVRGAYSTETAARFLGVAFLIFAAQPVVTAGHYNLYCSWGKDQCRDRVPKQERVAFAIAVPAVIGSSVWMFI